MHYTENNVMRIAVDAHAIGRKLTGNETYIRNIIRELARTDEESEYVAFFSAEGAERHIPKRFATRQVSNNPFVRLGYQLPRELSRLKPDLVHVQYTAPLVCPVPVVAVVHDISYLDHPEFFPQSRALQLKVTVARTVRTAARILTLSEYSRKAILRAYGINPELVHVIPLGVDPCFRPMSRVAALNGVRASCGIKAPYVLTVGDLQPRKNQVGLVKAFAELLKDQPNLPHHLVLVGKETWHGQEVREAARKSGVSERIHFTGFVTDEQLRELYCGCDLFVFPSFYEGFGLPVLEAMACGRAVASSNATSLPEVADSSALLFDPLSITEMVRAMRDLLVDAELLARMERLGLQNAARFSWERTARDTHEVYQLVAGRRTAAAGVPAASSLVRRP